MHINLAKGTFGALALLGFVQAHTRFTTLYVDGQNQGDAVCIRMDMDGRRTNHPVPGIQSPEMACGREGEKGVARVCPAKAGSTLTFEFREWVDGSQPGALAVQHEGPCAVYMKKVDSAIASDNAAGDGWFKIWDESYDEAAGKWCTNKMIENDGHISVTIPSDIEGGYYLVRPELLALHFAVNDPPDPQFYVGCAQIYLDSTGAAKPATISIPENYVDMSMPAMTFNIYDRPLALPYLMYGPPVYTAGGDQATPSAPEDRYPSVSSNAKIADTASEDAAGQSEKVVNGQAEGLKPEGCIMVNGNWCGFEVRSYTDEKGCWSSSAECWTQSKDCYDNAPPTGAKNCDLWGDKCNHLDDSCHAQQFYGPPDAGKDLTPTPPDLETTAAHKLMALVKKHENHHMRHAYRTHHQ